MENVKEPVLGENKQDITLLLLYVLYPRVPKRLSRADLPIMKRFKLINQMGK